METWHRRDPVSREGLARLMRDLSHYTTMLPLHRTTSLEARHVLEFLCHGTGLTEETRESVAGAVTPQVLGSGVNHAFWSPTGRLRVVEWLASESRSEGPPAEITPAIRSAFSQAAAMPNDIYEWWSLVGSRDESLPGEIDLASQHRYGTSYAQNERNFTEALREVANSEERTFHCIVRHLPELMSRFFVGGAEMGLDREQVYGLLEPYRGVIGVRFLMSLLPSFEASFLMHMAKYRNPQWVWTQHDLADLLCLPVAAAYSSVIVTERSWAHVLRSMRPGHGPQVRALSRVHELSPLLDELEGSTPDG